VDKCLFIRDNCIIIIYVDDCLIFSRDDKILEDILSHLGSVFQITSDMDVGAYLGLDIKCNVEGLLEITQPGLIDKVIAICGLEAASNEHRTPADSIIYATTENDAPCQLDWNYRQVIGILNYIATSSRPDILFKVHQCAWFSVAPRRSHELAVKQIVRYL
jgi:hypothetical protein